MPAATLSTGIPAVEPGAPRSALKRALLGVVATKPGTAFHRTVAARVDGPLMKATRGRVNLDFGAAPVVVLVSTGARSGLPREAPLLYFTQGEDVVLMASSYGRAAHPAWYRNLVAHPACELRVGAHGGRYVAREVHGEERDRLYALAERHYAGYGNYALTTKGVRTIPVLRLSPAA